MPLAAFIGKWMHAFSMPDFSRSSLR